MTVEELTKRLYSCYSKELCYPKVRESWNPNNRCFGMCAITSLIVNDYFGGDICKTYVDGISLFFNFIDEKIVDLTASQFQSKIDYLNYTVVKREDILTEDTKLRYHLLKSRLEDVK